MPRRSPKGEGGPRVRKPRAGKRKQLHLEVPVTYVYILRSTADPARHYIGVTSDLRARLQKHNSRDVPHTSEYAPWAIKTYVAFNDKKQAFAFERYLKSASGRAFAKKRL